MAQVIEHHPQELKREEAKVSVAMDLSCNMPLLRELAAKSDVDAQTRLGINLFYNGNSAEEKKEGAALLCKTAKSRTAEEQCALGICYLEGLGTKKDLGAAFKCFQVASSKYTPALYFLAECYEYGWGVSKDDQKALQSYKRAAEQGYARAYYVLGLGYQYGVFGLDSSSGYALQNYEMAANLGLTYVQNILGEYYGSSIGSGWCSGTDPRELQYQKQYTQPNVIPSQAFPPMFLFESGFFDGRRDYVKSLKYYRLAAAGGNIEAKKHVEKLEQEPTRKIEELAENAAESALDEIEDEFRQKKLEQKLAEEKAKEEKEHKHHLEFKQREEMENKEKDLSCNTPLLRELVAKGDVDAQTRLGISLRFGINIDSSAKDKREGIELLSKAATRSDTPAGQCALGYCYLYGLNKAEDPEAGFKCLQTASDQNYPPAQYALAECYAKGKGIMQSNSDALRFYEMAAKQGYTKAQYEIGRCYEWGELGVTENKSKALQYYEMATNRGNAHAQWILGSRYELGNGVTIDESKALWFYEMAAKQGHYAAQLNIIIGYEHGKFGLAKNDPKVLRYYRMAAKRSPYARRQLSAINEERKRKAAEEKARQEELQAKQKLAEEKAKEEKERQAKLEKEQKEKIELELKVKLEKEQKEKAELELKTKLAQEQQEKLKADQKLAEEKAKQEQEQQAKAKKEADKKDAKQTATDAKSSTQPQASIGLGSRIANFFAACWNRIRCCTTPQPARDPQEADDDPAELKAATAKLATSVQEMTTIVQRHEEKSGKDAKELQSLREEQAKLAQEVLEGMQKQDAKFAQSMLDSQAEFMEVNRQVRATHALAESKLSGSQDVMNSLTERQLAVYKAGLEQAFIFRSPNLSDFYYTFRQLLWQNWNAYSVGHSGKVSLSDKRLINYTVDAIDAIGQRIPGVGLLTGIAKRLVELGQSFDLKNAINQIAGFFDPGEETSAQIIDMLARKLTIAQQETIEKLTTQNQGVLRQFSQAFVRFKDAITVNDINTAIRKKAEEQVESLLIAIITGKLRPHPTLREMPQLFAAILGTEVPYPENLSAEAIATINANTSASTSAIPSAIYFAVPTSVGDTVSVSSTLSMSQSYVAPPPPSSTAELLSTLMASSSDVDARAKKAEEEAKKLQAELLRTQEEAKRAQEEAKKSQELLAKLAATQAEQQAEQARQAKLLESLARTSSAAHATAEQAIRATELTSGRVATVERTAEAAADTARNTNRQITTLEQEATRMRIETRDAKTKADIAHQAVIQSGLSISSGGGNTAQLSLVRAAQHNPVQTGDLPIATQLARVQAQVTEMAEHVERRLEAVETGGQPPGRKRKF